METTSISYKLIKKIKDDKFNIDHLEHYHLLLQLGPRDLQVAIIDSRSNQVLLLEDYILASVKTYGEFIEVLELIFDEHHLLLAGFWKAVKISIKNGKFSLVPSPLFDSGSLHKYLALNCQVDPDREDFTYFKHINTDAVNVFAVNKVINNWIQKTYPNTAAHVVHQSSALIEGVIRMSNEYPENSLFLYVDRFKLHILALKDSSLEYYNQFPIKQFSDYVKYIMLVMKGLGRNQQSSNVVLWGYVGKQSPHYNEFYKYIRNISFGDRPSYLGYGYIFDEVQDHHFFDLYNTFLCE